jgi:hypothetical protein
VFDSQVDYYFLFSGWCEMEEGEVFARVFVLFFREGWNRVSGHGGIAWRCLLGQRVWEMRSHGVEVERVGICREVSEAM